MNPLKLAGAVAFLAPSLDKSTVFRELDEAVVSAMAVVMAVADDDHGVKRQVTATLDDFGDPANVDDVLLHVAIAVVIATSGIEILLGQNSRPSSLAPSASALTRPWYW